MAAKFIKLTHLVSGSNTADVLSKHWGHRDVYHLIKPIMDWQGDTAGLY